MVALQEIHLQDQLAALDYLKRLPGVDPGGIAVAGCSYGGIQTILALEAGADGKAAFRAAVDFAGGAQTWRHSVTLQQRMVAAVRKATVPVMFVQAENDYDVSPSYVLAKELERLGKPHKLAVYPPFGTSVRDGHGGFCFRAPEVWGAEVLSFLDTYLKN